MDKRMWRRTVLVLGLAIGFAPACSDDGLGAPSTPDGSSGDRSDGGTMDPDAPTGDPEGGIGDADASPCRLAVSLGRLRGKVGESTCQYLGIPYAKPPVGPLRFSPPEPAVGWQGELEATAFGPSCMQRSSIVSGAANVSEDCLSLNVFAPEPPHSSKLPVMVFIHGGGYTLGGSSTYDASLLAAAGPVVVVTINYRLGALGFFAHPALDAQRPGAPSGSDGIRDQQLALRWVREHIASFGGDPENVTVFGESAGSGSASLILVSPRSRDLADRFILQSGASVGTGFGAGTREAGYALSTSLATELCSGAPDVIACLRERPAQELVEWTGSTPGLFGAPFAPIVEGRPGGVLPDTPRNLLSRGEYNRAATIMAGTNKNEWGLFQQPLLGGMPITTLTELEAALVEQFGARAAEVEAQYPATSDAEANVVYVRLMTDMLFRCPTRLLARLTTSHGSKFYLYSFEQGAAYHADELAYVFGNSSFVGMPPVPALVSVIQKYWTQFAATGDPNAAGLPLWPAYTAASDAHLVLKDPPEAGSGLARSDCDFWDAFAP